MHYVYPTYEGDFTRSALLECCDVAVRLVSEEGIVVRHDAFLDAVAGKPGVAIDGWRVRFDKAGVRDELDCWIDRTRERLQAAADRPADGRDDQWTISSGGTSIAVRDVETDEVRPATCEDLRQLIRLVESYDMGGCYPVAPQDLPPMMRTMACFKICWESSERVRPYDYLHISQTPFLYEMHQVMGQPFTVTLCVPQPMRIDENDLEVFLSFYDRWKRGEAVNLQVLDYAMLGISKPITSTGCFAMNLTNTLAVHMLFRAFDPKIDLALQGQVGAPVDFSSACWAWGHPRRHLYHYLAARALPVLCGVDSGRYAMRAALLEASSSALDMQTGMERMASCLVPALQGARHFTGAGSLCVDDLYSGVQFVVDVEIVRYVREIIESFTPHADVFGMEGLYELCRDCIREDDLFLSHPDTAAKLRNVLPGDGLIRREKLRSWLAHESLLADHARAEAVERMRMPQSFQLPDDKQTELDRIYHRAEEALAC